MEFFLFFVLFCLCVGFFMFFFFFCLFLFFEIMSDSTFM